MLEKYLQDIGLNEKESSIYIILLQIDSASVIEIAKKTNINRSTTYTVLDSLSKKGLVGEIQIGKKAKYQAEKPERLETYIEKQKILLEEQSKRLKDIIPMLKSVQRETGERPMVKYFEGREGIISSTEEFFTGEETNDVSYFFYPKDLVDKVLTETEKKRYHNIRLKKNIRAKVLYAYKNGELQSDAMGERLKINGDVYPITCEISIFRDRVKISTMGKSLSGIFIRSKDLADTLRSIFNLIYDCLKKEK